MPYARGYRRAARRPGGWRKRVATGNTKVPVKKVVRKYNNKLFKARVQRVLKSQIETKMKVWNICNNTSTIGTGLVKGTPSVQRGIQFYNILGEAAGGGMNMIRGLTQETFLGNKIENCKLRVRGLVKTLPWNSSTNPAQNGYEITLLFYKNKDTKAADPNNLKQYPNNTNDKISSVEATLYPWNRSQYVIKKVHTMRMRSLERDTSQEDAIINPQSSTGPAYRRFSFSVPIAKTLVIPDLDNAPGNDWCGLGIYITNGAGTAYGQGTHFASVYMDGIFTYQDA